MELIWDAIRPILEREGIKEKRGKWIGNAPSLLNPGSDSGSFVATPNPNLQNGVWNYTAGGRSGTFINSDPSKCLATILGIDKSKYSHMKYKAKQTPVQNHLDYAKAHYVEWSVFEAAGWHLESFNDRPALYVPCRDGINRLRFLDGKSPKWQPERAGISPQWYGLEKAIDMKKEALVICNGQPSVIVGNHYGVPACALTDGENKTPPPERIAELNKTWQGQIIIAMDCDDAGKASAEKWLSVLPNAISIDLNGSDGFDLADHCGLFTDKAYATLLQYANIKKHNTDIEPPPPPKPVDPIKDLHGAVSELANNIKGDDTRAKEAIKRAESIIEAYNAQQYGVELTTGSLDAIDLFEEIDERVKNPQRITGLKTSFDKLNYAIGGIQSEIMTILAVQGIGKSTLMASLCTDLMMQADGIILPTEMQRKQFIMMMLARMASTPERPITTYALQTGYLRQWDVVKDGSKEYYVKCEERLSDGDKLRIRDARIRLYDKLSKGHILWPTLANPNAKALYMTIQKAKDNNPNLKWMVVDSISHLAGSGGSGKDERHKLNDMVYTLVDITTQLDIAIIATAQIGRAVKNREDKQPKEEDAKESGIIEQASSKVFGLYYHHHYVMAGDAKPNHWLPEGIAQLQLLKGRFVGGTGSKIRLQYRGGAGYWHYD